MYLKRLIALAYLRFVARKTLLSMFPKVKYPTNCPSIKMTIFDQNAVSSLKKLNAKRAGRVMT